SFFFFSSRRRHTRSDRDWSSDVCSSDLWTIWLIANGAAGRSGWSRSHAPSASLISCSHSSSWEAGRALSAGKAPTIPDVHWAIKIGRASCRERVEVSGGAVALEEKV